MMKFTKSLVVARAVPPGDVTADHEFCSSWVRWSVPLRANGRKAVKCALDPVEERGVGRHVGQLDVVRRRPTHRPGRPVWWTSAGGRSVPSTMTMRTSGGYNERRYRQNSRNKMRPFLVRFDVPVELVPVFMSNAARRWRTPWGPLVGGPDPTPAGATPWKPFPSCDEPPAPTASPAGATSSTARTRPSRTPPSGHPRPRLRLAFGDVVQLQARFFLTS